MGETDQGGTGPEVEPTPEVEQETLDQRPGRPHQEQGLELAREIAKATVATGGTAPKRRRRAGNAKKDGRIPRGRISGARPDERDPQLLESTVERVVADRGWDVDLRVHGLFGRWAELVGDDIGEHTTPETFEDGRLVVRTNSTAWATQLRLLAPQLVKRLNQELGHGTVSVIEVLSPHGPSWKKGRLSVRDGRGPRDTYG